MRVMKKTLLPLLLLVPVLLALIPITILVMTVSGCVTQRLAERKEKKQ